MKNVVALSLLLSVMVHVCLLYQTISSSPSLPPLPPPPPSSGNTSPHSAKIKIIEKEHTVRKIDCKNFYYGIGITTTPSGNKVARVYRGYPAWEAGLLAGDTIIEPEISKIRGTKGTLVRIKIFRNGEVIILDMTRAQICGVIKDR